MTCTDVQTWTSYPGLAAQTWYLTADGRIAITGGNQCLDEGANGESPIYSHPLSSFPLVSLLTWTSFASLVLAITADNQVPRLINVPLEIPIKVSPSINHPPHSNRHPPSQTYSFFGFSLSPLSLILLSLSHPLPLLDSQPLARPLTSSMDHQAQNHHPSPPNWRLTKRTAGYRLPRSPSWRWKANPSIWKGRSLFDSSRWSSYLWYSGSSVCLSLFLSSFFFSSCYCPLVK
jgi:hypothetical protein